jgi:hypothetical protein
MFGEAALLACIASTWFMTGLIWFVQIVHYPLLASVGPDRFVAYHRAHARLTTGVVLVPMLVELFSATVVAWTNPASRPALSYAGLGLAIAIWGCTFLVQVPLHERLATGWEPRTHRRLVRTNWIRTVLWSLHALVTLALYAFARR